MQFKKKTASFLKKNISILVLMLASHWFFNGFFMPVSTCVFNVGFPMGISMVSPYRFQCGFPMGGYFYDFSTPVLLRVLHWFIYSSFNVVFSRFKTYEGFRVFITSSWLIFVPVQHFYLLHLVSRLLIMVLELS